MKKHYFISLACIMMLAFSVSSCTDEPKNESPNNVILMIGDGMSTPQIYAAMLALDRPLSFERFPYTGLVKTYSDNKRITDSAAGGTAIAIGKKTNNGFIGMTPDSVAQPSMLDLMHDSGKKTGVVVTCSLTHATPASFIAKNPSRNNNYEIAEYIAGNERVDFMAGGGRKYFFNRKDSVDLRPVMEANGWSIYDNLADVSLASQKIAVMVADKHPDTFPNRGDFLPDAIDTALSFLSSNGNGFFLMVEGSQIDFAAHANDSTYLVNEMDDFDHAISRVLRFAENDGNTLVLVTADHETGGLTMIDPEGKYTNVCYRFSTRSHSPLMVPIFAYGPGACNFSGIIDNTDILPKVLELTK